jgi:predicted aldo/keto reductase-like oxidoreductase
MRYNKFGRVDFNVSTLGFGAMRLPKVKDTEEIDEEAAMEMIYHAIDNGVNYIDTAYPYHNKKSESFLGKILNNGYREKVKLATKLPPWHIKIKQDCDRIFSEQLEKLRTDSIDFYLFHSLNKQIWENLKKVGVIQWAENKIADTSIGYIGFSFHGSHSDFIQIIDDYDWDFCQIQYNYIDIENQAGKKGLLYAASKGIAVVIMEPLLGGKLVKPPAHIKAIWDTAQKKRSPAGWALLWLWNQPEVTTVLSGMSSISQVKENLHYADNAYPHILTNGELALFEKVRAEYNKLCPIPCTSCEYCKPCPSGVDITWNFNLYNDGVMYNSPKAVRVEYEAMPEEKKADKCTGCGQCEELCPQGIKISEWMPRVHKVLGEGEPFPELQKGY